MHTDSVDEALAALVNGDMVIITDDVVRRESHLVVAAEHATTRTTTFFVDHTAGFITAAITSARANDLDLPPQVCSEEAGDRPRFTVSVDFVEGTTTGISAADRGRTIRALADPESNPGDFTRPGHVIPVVVDDEGVLARPEFAEAAVDLVKAAGLAPVAMISEIVDPTTFEIAVGPSIVAFARDHQLPIVSVQQIAKFQADRKKYVRRDPTVTRLSSARGELRCWTYEAIDQVASHLAIVNGQVRGRKNVAVHLHLECIEGDVLGSTRCGCRAELASAVQSISSRDTGVVIYIRDGRHHVEESDVGATTRPRYIHAAAQIIEDLGITSVQLIGGSPHQAKALSTSGVTVNDYVRLISGSGPDSSLRTAHTTAGWAPPASSCSAS